MTQQCKIQNPDEPDIPDRPWHPDDPEEIKLEARLLIIEMKLNRIEQYLARQSLIIPN